MSFVSIGDLSQTFAMRHSVTSAKHEISALGREVASGTTSDLRKTMGGNLEPIARIGRSISRLEATLNALNLQGPRVDAKQDVTTAIYDTLSEQSDTLISVIGVPGSINWQVVEATTESTLDTVIGMANTAALGATLFSGSMTSSPAFVSPGELQVLFSTAVSGVQTLSDFETVLDDFFAPNGDFENVAFLGNGDTGAPIRLNERIIHQVPGNGLDPAFKETIKASLHAWALSGDQTLIPEGAKAEALEKSIELTGGAIGHVIEMGRQIGQVQTEIEIANVRLASEKSMLELSMNEFVAVDPYEATTKLQAMQQQLETLYLLSSRSQQISLLDYM